MQQVTITWKRLHVYWKATNASKKWQLLAYDAIIKSKLLYGLETAQVGKAGLKRIDAFQLKGIRQILGTKHTYWDRDATNHLLFDMASRIISETNKEKKGNKTDKGNQSRQHMEWGSHIRQALETEVKTTEDKRVSTEKWLYKDNYDALVANETLTGHRGNTNGINKMDDANKGNKQTDTLRSSQNALG